MSSASLLEAEQRKAFDAVDKEIIDRAETTKGKTDWQFCFGVTYALALAWSMGACPQHVWLLYIVCAISVFPPRIVDVMKPKEMMIVKGEPKQAFIRFFYLFEFCYYANFFGMIVLVVLALDLMNKDIAHHLFSAGFGIACGPLFCATYLFGNKVLFHDMTNTVSILIHLIPCMVMYTLRWNYTAVHESWTYLFHRGPFDGIPLLDIYANAALFYATWFVPYTIWLLTNGRTVPARRDFDTCLRLNKNGDSPYDTVFHFNMRDPGVGMGKKFICGIFGKSAEELRRKQLEADYTVLEVFIHNIFHGCLAMVMILVSLLFYKYQLLHAIALAFVSVISIYRGSGVYAKNIAFLEQYNLAKGRAWRPRPQTPIPSLEEANQQ